MHICMYAYMCGTTAISKATISNIIVLCPSNKMEMEIVPMKYDI